MNNLSSTHIPMSYIRSNASISENNPLLGAENLLNSIVTKSRNNVNGVGKLIKHMIFIINHTTKENQPSAMTIDSIMNYYKNIMQDTATLSQEETQYLVEICTYKNNTSTINCDFSDEIKNIWRQLNLPAGNGRNYARFKNKSHKKCYVKENIGDMLLLAVKVIADFKIDLKICNLKGLNLSGANLIALCVT